MAWEAGQCPSCLNWDALEPLPQATRDVTWEEHGGRVARVHQYRCIYCGAADLIRRDFHKAHEKDESTPGHASPSDGRIFVARPPEED